MGHGLLDVGIDQRKSHWCRTEQIFILSDGHQFQRLTETKFWIPHEDVFGIAPHSVKSVDWLQILVSLRAC